MVNVLRRGVPPRYLIECPECNSLLEFTASDLTNFDELVCPICGITIWIDKFQREGEHYEKFKS